jgi:hypothetical protein
LSNEKARNMPEFIKASQSAFQSARGLQTGCLMEVTTNQQKLSARRVPNGGIPIRRLLRAAACLLAKFFDITEAKLSFFSRGKRAVSAAVAVGAALLSA